MKYSMEIHSWALRILTATTLEEKLLVPDELTDFEPGPKILINEPSRPSHMGLCKRPKKEKLPSFQDLNQVDHRAICLHRFAGHELLAVEIMAYALLAFPEAPKNFRKGVAHTLKEEQGHVKMYQDRMREMGLEFGDLPLYRHFWNHVPYLIDPIHYVSVMSLTFEMANLDFAPMYQKHFSHFGDTKSASLMDQILQDELRHVSFGYRWLEQMKNPENSSWDTWTHSQGPKLDPKRSMGFVFHEKHRQMAGIPNDWIQKFKEMKNPPKDILTKNEHKSISHAPNIFAP